jgi:hypothetical protein
VTPTSDRPRPRSNKLSVTEGTSETTRLGAEVKFSSLRFPMPVLIFQSSDFRGITK